MANTVKITKLMDGVRNLILGIYLKSDGASGELVNETLVTPADVGLKPGQRLRIKYVMYNFAGFDAVLEFGSGGVTPNFKWVMSEGANAPADFGPFQDLHDDSGMDGNGKLQINTTGFTASTDQGSILLLLRKP